MTRLIKAGRADTTRLPARPSLLNQRTLWLFLLLLAIAWSLAQANVVGRAWINPGGWSLLLSFLQASLRPDRALFRSVAGIACAGHLHDGDSRAFDGGNGREPR